MSLGPFLRRELATSVRGGRAFDDRRVALILASSTVLGCLRLWDWLGWDRSSLLGTDRFGLTVAVLLVGGMGVLAYGVVVQQVAGSIAAERDRKTLDALLASRFSSAEIVLGAVASGLFRYVNALASVVPIVVLVVYMGGVAPIWAALAGVGLASTALLLAGFSVAASVESRTRARAVVAMSGMFTAWFALPPFYLIFRPMIWPGAPLWLTWVVKLVADGSVMGLLMNVLGVVPRPGGPIVAVGRMVGWQLVWSLGLIAWSILRLRPASRSLYDVEGERGRLRRLKASLRRAPRRPPCSDDPVFWSEAYSSRSLGLISRLLNGTIALATVGALALTTWWFARPAFAELAATGYGPTSGALARPLLHPLIKLMVGSKIPGLAATANVGQARLEFNIVLRLLAGMSTLGFALAAFSGTFEAIKRERTRETWLGLLATPLTAREILRGKAFGAIWKLRWGALLLVAPWTVGLLAGAVHPLGYLAAVGLLAVSAVFFAHLGLLMALRDWDPETGKKSPVTLIQVPIVLVGSVVLTIGPMVLAWASLLTYDDVAAAIRSGPFPELSEGTIGELLGARGVLIAWLIGAGALGFGARWLDRTNERGFDRLVGRPVRPVGSATPRAAKLI